jgi:hypothetical protein
MISSMIRCGYCMFWQLLFKAYFEIVKDIISKYSAHQPMNIMWPKSIYCKFGKQPTLIFRPICMYHTYFGTSCLKMINIFTKCNTHISKIPFEIQEITTTYLPTQIWVLHVWPKKPSPIFSLKCNYCKSTPKIHYIFYDPYVNYCNFGHIS